MIEQNEGIKITETLKLVHCLQENNHSLVKTAEAIHTRKFGF